MNDDEKSENNRNELKNHKDRNPISMKLIVSIIDDAIGNHNRLHHSMIEDNRDSDAYSIDESADHAPIVMNLNQDHQLSMNLNQKMIDQKSTKKKDAELHGAQLPHYRP